MPTTDHYRLLVRADQTIDRAMLFRIAHRKARAERAGFVALGCDRPYARCLAETLRQVWEHVNATREAMRAAAGPLPAVDRPTALQRELELLPLPRGLSRRADASARHRIRIGAARDLSRATTPAAIPRPDQAACAA
jgi:hypothetical protein